MGQTLSEPVTQKETSHCENEFLKVGTSCMQGWRISLFYFRFIFLKINFKFNLISKIWKMHTLKYYH